MLLVQLSASFQSLPATHKQIGPFWCWFPGEWVCVHSRTLWVSPTNSPVRLGISPTTSPTPTVVFSQRLSSFISPWWSPRLCGLSCPSVVPPSLTARKCGTAQSTIRHLACPGPPATALLQVLSTSCLSPPLLPVWMNISSLTSWLLDFHTVRFSVSSGCFLFLSSLLSFFWLCKEAQYVYLLFHLARSLRFFKIY